MILTWRLRRLAELPCPIEWLPHDLLLELRGCLALVRPSSAGIVPQSRPGGRGDRRRLHDRADHGFRARFQERGSAKASRLLCHGDPQHADSRARPLQLFRASTTRSSARQNRKLRADACNLFGRISCRGVSRRAHRHTAGPAGGGARDRAHGDADPHLDHHSADAPQRPAVARQHDDLAFQRHFACRCDRRSRAHFRGAQDQCRELPRYRDLDCRELPLCRNLLAARRAYAPCGAASRVPR